MNTPIQFSKRDNYSITGLRTLADQAFSRAAGAPLVEGNHIRLLKDARENYPAWLDAIKNAAKHVHFETFIIHEDHIGRKFRDALVAKAGEGVKVRLIYDWIGGFGKASRRFWNSFREGGVEVRCYNPPRIDSPLGWLSRDHRKLLAVDGKVAFVSGLCIGRSWEGIPEKKIDPWRDTGVEVRGPAVAELENAFAHVWGLMGDPITDNEQAVIDQTERSGDTNLRVVASIPATAGMFRLDLLVAGLARKRLWLTDAYYAGTTPYVQALRAAARDGVDVRILLPNSSDIPLLRPLSRAGYRPLLAAGVRIFEWNGSMLHAKTAVADGHWARVGSTNLNITSWLGNYELDVVVEDEPFAREMEDMYLEDLTNSTEIILDEKQKVHPIGEPHRSKHILTTGRGRVGRAAAGMARIGSTVGAVFTDRRVLEPVEANLMIRSGALLLLLSVLFIFFPQLLAYPLIFFIIWFGATLLYRGYRLRSGINESKDSENNEQ